MSLLTRIFSCAAPSQSHPLCPQATRAVSKLLRQNDAVFFCSQNIAEFWNIATRPAEMNGLGLSDEEVQREVGNIESLLALLPDIPAIYPVWKRLSRTTGFRA